MHWPESLRYFAASPDPPPELLAPDELADALEVALLSVPPEEAAAGFFTAEPLLLSEADTVEAEASVLTAAAPLFLA
jgi:hypothetical protein